MMGTAATYAVLAPINAMLSAIFPRKVNLASIGRDSNPHQAANFLGFVSVVAAAAPAALAAAAGALLFRSAGMTALLVGVGPSPRSRSHRSRCGWSSASCRAGARICCSSRRDARPSQDVRSAHNQIAIVESRMPVAAT